MARALGADLGRGEAVVGAQEFEVRMTPQQAERSPVRGDTPQLYFCPDLAGYAWVVRKGDWLNVGIGRRGPRELAGHLERFLAAMVRDGVLEPELARTRPHGHAYLLYPDAARPLVADGALLVGDAAGLAYRRAAKASARRSNPRCSPPRRSATATGNTPRTACKPIRKRSGTDLAREGTRQVRRPPMPTR